MGRKKGILGAQQAVPAHQDPWLSCRTSPILLSLCLPHQAPSTYPLSRHSRGASITTGTTHAILARVPRLPLPGKGTVSEGTVLYQEYTVLVLCGLGWKDRNGLKMRHRLKKRWLGSMQLPVGEWGPQHSCRIKELSSTGEPGASSARARDHNATQPRVPVAKTVLSLSWVVKAEHPKCWVLPQDPCGAGEPGAHHFLWKPQPYRASSHHRA